jgi:hypothetical protein
MVSGFVTSPCDQLRIFSGEASEMRIASKSVMGLVISNGLERYKVNLPAVAFPDLIRGPVHFRERFAQWTGPVTLNFWWAGWAGAKAPDFPAVIHRAKARCFYR